MKYKVDSVLMERFTKYLPGAPISPLANSSHVKLDRPAYILNVKALTWALVVAAPVAMSSLLPAGY